MRADKKRREQKPCVRKRARNTFKPWNKWFIKWKWSVIYLLHSFVRLRAACASVSCAQSIDGSAKMLVCLRVSIDQPLTLYECAWSLVRCKRRDSNTFRVSRDCSARCRYPGTQLQLQAFVFFFQNAFTIPAKRFPLPLSLGSSCGMHFSVMKMAQRTESRKATQAEDERKRDLKMCETSEWKEKKREITEIATANRKEWIGRCKFSHHIPSTHDARRIPYLPRPSRFESHKLPVGYNVSLAQPLDAISHSHTFVVVGGAAAAREIIIETVLDITLAPTVASTHISTEAPWLIAVVAHTHTHTFVHSSRWNRRKKKQFMRFCEYQHFM